MTARPASFRAAFGKLSPADALDDVEVDGLRSEHNQRVERRKYRGEYRGDYNARDYRMEFLHDERGEGELGGLQQTEA